MARILELVQSLFISLLFMIIIITPATGSTDNLNGTRTANSSHITSTLLGSPSSVNDTSIDNDNITNSTASMIPVTATNVVPNHVNNNAYNRSATTSEIDHNALDTEITPTAAIATGFAYTTQNPLEINDADIQKLLMNDSISSTEPVHYSTVTSNLSSSTTEPVFFSTSISNTTQNVPFDNTDGGSHASLTTTVLSGELTSSESSSLLTTPQGDVTVTSTIPLSESSTGTNVKTVTDSTTEDFTTDVASEISSVRLPTDYVTTTQTVVITDTNHTTVSATTVTTNNSSVNVESTSQSTSFNGTSATATVTVQETTTVDVNATTDKVTTTTEAAAVPVGVAEGTNVLAIALGITATFLITATLGVAAYYCYKSRDRYNRLNDVDVRFENPLYNTAFQDAAEPAENDDEEIYDGKLTFNFQNNAA